MTFRIWAQVPGTSKRFSQIAQGLTQEQVDVYKNTYNYPITVMDDTVVDIKNEDRPEYKE
jgi:hypothetical protein